MKKYHLFVSFMLLLYFPIISQAGSLDAPGFPSLGSVMPTTADIYNQLNIGATASVPGFFREPVSDPAVGAFPPETLLITSSLISD